MKLEPGSKIGDYEVLGKLGAGGMGSVYKVRNELSDRVEAMKVLLPDLEGHADLGNRFLREIKVQAGMDHPNIAKLYTALRIDNQLLMCMELVEGVPLDQRLREGPIALVDAVDYAVQVLSALEYAHQRGVVHRDIKPANMMLMPDGKIKLLDFGIAKASDNRLTVTGTTLGSLYYMSPEQIQGGQVDVRSDVYSVGVSLYELVTGKKPFDAESQFAIMSAHLARTPVAPIELNTAMPPEVSEIILKALNKEPGARFQTAGEFYDALHAVQEEVGYGAGTTVNATGAPRTNLRMTSLPLPRDPAKTRASSLDAPLGDSLRMTALQRPAMASPPAHTPAVETAPPEKKSDSKRLIWVAVGSLCAVGAIVAFIQFGPKGNTSAKETTPFTVNEPPAGAAAQKPSALSPPVAKPGKPIPDSSQQPPTQHAQAPVQQAPAAPSASAPPSEQPATSQAPPPNSGFGGSGAPQPGAINKDRVEIQRLSERMDLMYQRAKTVRNTLQDLQAHPGPQGGPKNEWVESFNRLNQFLKQAGAAINDGNPTNATEALSKAANELDGLEKALGK
jgi:serine/threonine-protein kinase